MPWSWKLKRGTMMHKQEKILWQEKSILLQKGILSIPLIFNVCNQTSHSHDLCACSLISRRATRAEFYITCKWKYYADKYARYVLTLFRPEPDFYKDQHENSFSYNWDALKKFISRSQSDGTLISQLQLKAMETHLQKMHTTYRSKCLLSKYHGRNCKLWDKEDYRKFNSQDWNEWQSTSFESTELDDLAFEWDHAELSCSTNLLIKKQLQYCQCQRHSIDKIYGAFDNQYWFCALSSNLMTETCIWEGPSTIDIDEKYHGFRTYNGLEILSDDDAVKPWVMNR